MIRRIAAGLVLLVGAFWLVSPFALGYSGKTAAVDDMTGDFRPVFSDAGLEQTNADIGTVNAFAAQFHDEAVPSLARQLGISPDEFVSALGHEYPEVGAGMQQLPESLPYFNATVDALNQQQGNFHDATRSRPGSCRRRRSTGCSWCSASWPCSSACSCSAPHRRMRPPRPAGGC